MDAVADLTAEFGFHPLIARWFAGKFGQPTEPQRLGWPSIAAGEPTLIAAPTGSGKTLTAFLAVLDRLIKEGEAGTLGEELRVVYVSPLRALSDDMHRNLSVPLQELQQLAEEEGRVIPPLKVGLRTGDSTASERAALIKRPPHLLVTTPESLYLLLTSDRGRERLQTVEVVIIDEIHALMRDKRGSHLALSLERLEHLCGRPLQRIGLSATQKPLELVADFLQGGRRKSEGGSQQEITPSPPSDFRLPTSAFPLPTACQIINVGHTRELDLDVEVPVDELSAVCSYDHWDRIHARLVELIQSHRSTVIFVNTRRLAERLTYSLSELLGPDQVMSHHGSLSADLRHKTEQRLKSGQLQAVVATASLELGLDIGYIDLVVQIGSPRSIATFLQRIGRSGHCLHAIPKGRIVPLTRDEFLESLALLRAVKSRRLDAIRPPEHPLDVLVQQVVAEASCQEWDVDELFALCRRAHPYRQLSRDDFEEALRFLSEGFVSNTGRGRVYLHYDRVGQRIRSRPMARPAAVSNAGAIPEIATYRVVAEPEHTVVGSVDEDFAIESARGDVFLLGNNSWRIEHVRGGDVTVSDAHGAPPTIPFWFGEGPGRTLELSEEVSRLRADLEARVEDLPAAVAWLIKETDFSNVNAHEAGRHSDASLPTEKPGFRQIVEYVAVQKAAIGVVPRQEQIVFERFFDQTGGMQLVVHAPFGSGITRAWGYAMRKRFCRSFDFELQATADDDGFILSIGPQHSFPIESLFGMLTSNNARELLEQALLVLPLFQVRWRWNVTRALLVLKQKFGKKVPPALQRFRADDLLTAVFPNLTGCQENHTGDIEIPDHPLVRQTMHDCLHEALDIDGLIQVLRRIEQGEIQLIARDTREPSPFCYELLNSNPYTFLDGGEIQERRTRAMSAPSTLAIDGMRDLGWLDPAAIAQVVQEAAPLVRSADELHDFLLSVMVQPAGGVSPEIDERLKPDETWPAWFTELAQQRRAVSWTLPDGRIAWTPVERWPAVAAMFPNQFLPPGFSVPAGVPTDWEETSARVAVIRGWMEFCGPVAPQALAIHLGFTASQTSAALEALEGEGSVLRGQFTPNKAADGIHAAQEHQASPSRAPETEWCHRRLLSRIHRLTLAGLRKQIEPVDVSVFQRFLFEHHGLAGDAPRSGANGLFEVISLLQGLDLPAITWERDILPGRLSDYEPAWLDELCLSGETGWGRLYPPQVDGEKSRPAGNLTRVVPLSIYLRADLPWLASQSTPLSPEWLGSLAEELRELLSQHGALFAADLLQLTRMLPDHFQEALGELIARGLVTADGFGGLRALMTDKAESSGRRTAELPRGVIRKRTSTTGSGRWSLWRRPTVIDDVDRTAHIEAWAWQLLRRWSVVFRDLLERETGAPRWWELLQVYRRLEALGELRGGRFITGVAGEQFTLESTVRRLRDLRDAGRGQAEGGTAKEEQAGDDFPPTSGFALPTSDFALSTSAGLVCLNAADPLNLTGILDSSPRVASLSTNRVAYLDGVAVAAMVGGEIVWLTSVNAGEQPRITHALSQQSDSRSNSGRRRHAAHRTRRRPDPPNQIPRPLIR
ncbi:MAG: DEAD/DEAH box helicase [Planctomycetaceae bacterium]